MEQTESIDVEQATVFGATTAQLLAQYGTVAGSLTWAQFDILPFDVNYSHASGTTAFELRELEVSSNPQQLTITPTAELVETSGVAARDLCNRSRIEVPVTGRITTQDGALDEVFDGTLTFFSGAYAQLIGTVAGPYAGEFGFDQSEYRFEGEVLRPGLGLTARLWPDGSEGALFPTFEVVDIEYDSPLSLSNVPAYSIGANTPPAGWTTPTAQSQLTGDLDVIVTPQYYGTLANWPDERMCAFTYDRFHADSDRLNGFAPRDVAAILNPIFPVSFDAESGSTQVTVEFERVAEELCASVDGSLVSFKMRGTVVGQQAPGDDVSPSPISNLDTTTVVTARYRAGDQGGLVEIGFLPDFSVPHAPLTRELLESTTGIAVPEDEDYAAYYWALQGRLVPSSDGWQYTVGLQVYGLSLDEASQYALSAQNGATLGTLPREPEHGFLVLPGVLVFETLATGIQPPIAG